MCDIPYHYWQHQGAQYQIIGICSLCRGQVIVPMIWHGVNKPTPICQSCGAVALTAPLPIIPMNPTPTVKYLDKTVVTPLT